MNRISPIIVLKHFNTRNFDNIHPTLTGAHARMASSTDNSGVESVENREEVKLVTNNDDHVNQMERFVVGAEDVDVDKQQGKVPDNKEQEEKDEPTKDAKSDTPERVLLREQDVVDDSTRKNMFEEALTLDKKGNKSEALKCYLKCLVGLRENSQFALLPQCLRNIGDIYYSKDEYDKAISFIQAEKLYYESVLIDDTDLQKHIDEVTAQGDGSTDGDTNMDSLRAAEYEQLAKLCMDEKQPQLALEYAGKATKLRQKVYGDGHPLVQQSLDYFATVYAEVGKVQYTESMSKYDTSGEPDMTGGATLHQSPEPASILRKRKSTESDKEKKVRFDETQVPSEEINEHEEKWARMVLIVLFFMLLFVLVVLGGYIYCQLYPSNRCVNFRQIIHNVINKVRYWYYQYTSDKDNKYV